MAHRDSQTGEYNETYPLEAFVQTLDRLGGDVGTKDVEEAVGCEYRTAIAKLHELEDRGLVTFRRVGNAYLWSLPATCNMASTSQNEDASQEREAAPEGEKDDDPIEGGVYQADEEFK
jgi:hypothetical protein